MRRRFLLAFKDAAVVSLAGFLVTLLPSATASAALDKTFQGSNPHGAFCRTLYPKGEKLPADGVLPSLPKHLSSDAIQEIVITGIAKEIKQYQLILHAPSGAPSSVMKEIPVAISFLRDTESQYLRLKGPSQPKSPKDFNAGFGAVLAVGKYIFQQCGGIGSSGTAVQKTVVGY